MGKRFAFDVQAAIKAAWEVCWADNLKCRNTQPYRPGQTYYLTASDLVNQVRMFAENTAEGKPWGNKRAWGRGYGSRVRLSGNIQSAVRDWLRREERAGRLASHNFGRGHCSGQRYRPAGEPISEAEQETFKAKAAHKDKPLHMYKKTGEYSSSFMCAPVKKRHTWSRHRSQARVTREAVQVTCPRCLKLLAVAKEAA